MAAGWIICMLSLIYNGISVNNCQGTSWHNDILGVVKHAVMVALSPDSLLHMSAPVADEEDWFCVMVTTSGRDLKPFCDRKAGSPKKGVQSKIHNPSPNFLPPPAKKPRPGKSKGEEANPPHPHRPQPSHWSVLHAHVHLCRGSPAYSLPVATATLNLCRTLKLRKWQR